jgi:hypothetical protein
MWVKVRSGSPGLPIAQEAAREFKFAIEPKMQLLLLHIRRTCANFRATARARVITWEHFLVYLPRA